MRFYRFDPSKSNFVPKSNFVFIKDMDPYKIYFDQDKDTFVTICWGLDDIVDSFEDRDFQTVLGYTEDMIRRIPY